MYKYIKFLKNLKKIKYETRKYFKRNENEYATYQNFWDTVKAVLGKKFMHINTYSKKE